MKNFVLNLIGELMRPWHVWWAKFHMQEQQYWQIRADLMDKYYDYSSQETAAMWHSFAAHHHWRCLYHANRPKYHF